MKKGRDTRLTEDELTLGFLLLKYLRTATHHQPANKYNVIGRSGQGEFEACLGRDLSAEERRSAIWLWDELRRLRLIAPSGTDLVAPDDWILVTTAGAEISQDDFNALLNPPQVRTKQLPDAVTGLLQRSELDFELAAALSKLTSDDPPISFLMIDIDFFKKFNDQFGHQVGDKVLGRVGQVVSSVVAGKGKAFRYGGEELTALLPNHTVDEALPIAERIRKGIEDIRLSSHLECRVTASLGVATFPDTCTNVENLVGDADRALYKAKEEGRNCVRLAERRSSGQPVTRPASAKLVIGFAPAESKEFLQHVLAVDAPGTSLWSPPVTGYGSTKDICNALYIRCRISNVGGRPATQCVVTLDQVSSQGTALESESSPLYWTHADSAGARALAPSDNGFVDVCAVYRGSTDLRALSQMGRKGYGRLPRPGEYTFDITATDFDSGSQDSIRMTVSVGLADWDDIKVVSVTKGDEVES